MKFYSQRHIASGLTSAIVVIVLIGATNAKLMGEDSANKSTVKQLMEEQRKVLLQLVKVQQQAYATGEAEIIAVIRAHEQLQRVEVEIATSRQQRIDRLKQSVALRKELEKIAAARYHAAEASEADVLQSRANRLQAEIELQRELAKPE